MKRVLSPLKLFLFIIISFLCPILLHAQSYTYSLEGFEENIWANASSTFTQIPSSTGTWTAAKDNVHTTAVTAYEGNFSFFIKNKTASLVTPRLDNGAGVLTYYTVKTSNR